MQRLFFFYYFTQHFQRHRCLPIWLRVNTADVSAKADSKEYAGAPKSILMGLFRCKGFPRASDSVYSSESAFAKGAIISASRAAFLICGGAEMQEWPFFFFSLMDHTELHGGAVVTGRIANRLLREVVQKMQNRGNLPFVSLLFHPADILFLIRLNSVTFFSARATIIGHYLPFFTRPFSQWPPFININQSLAAALSVSWDVSSVHTGTLAGWKRTQCYQQSGGFPHV